jgi:hypothetical protein
MNEQFIYLVIDENGGLEFITPSLAQAEKFIGEFGNENWKIESEVMC